MVSHSPTVLTWARVLGGMHRYWVIAGVLGAYWARETASMAACYALVSPTTQRMIAASCVYHWAKIALVSLDAHNKSPPAPPQETSLLPPSPPPLFTRQSPPLTTVTPWQVLPAARDHVAAHRPLVPRHSR